MGTQILNICCCALFYSKVHSLILCTKDIHISPSLIRTRHLEVVEAQILPAIANKENALVFWQHSISLSHTRLCLFVLFLFQFSFESLFLIVFTHL